MKTSLRVAGLVPAFVVALLLLGCVTNESYRYERVAPARAEHRPTTYALVLEFEGEAPTPEALATVRARFGDYFLKQGCTLVDDPSAADYLVRIVLAHEDAANPAEWSVVNSVTERNASNEGYAEASPPVFVSHSYCGSYGDWADDRYSGYPYFDDFGWAPLFGGIVIIAPHHPRHDRHPVRPAGPPPAAHPPVRPANDHRVPPAGPSADQNGQGRPPRPAGVVPGDERLRPGTPGHRENEPEQNRPPQGNHPTGRADQPVPAGTAPRPHPPTNPATPTPAPGPRSPASLAPVPAAPARTPDHPARLNGGNQGPTAPAQHPQHPAAQPPPTPSSGDKVHPLPPAGESTSRDGRFQPHPPTATPAPANSSALHPGPVDKPTPRVSPPKAPAPAPAPPAPAQTHAPTRPVNQEVHPALPPASVRSTPPPTVVPAPRSSPPPAAPAASPRSGDDKDAK